MSVDLSKLDAAKIASHVCGLLAEVAKATPTPLDDLVVAQAEPIILAWLQGRIVRQGVTSEEHYAVAAERVDDDARKRLEAKGVPPWLIAILLEIGGKLLEKWLKK